MTTYPLQLPDLSAPPAANGEENPVLNGLVEENLTLRVEVPVVSLRAGEKLCKHPDDPSKPVDWAVTDRDRDEDGALVFTYRTPEGVEDTLRFEDLGTFVWVDLGPVKK